MVRLELVANRSVEDAIMEKLSLVGCSHFSKIPIVYGEGNQDPKYGDSIWPETNFILIIYCEDELIPKIQLAIKTVKAQFKCEGIHLFCTPAKEI